MPNTSHDRAPADGDDMAPSAGGVGGIALRAMFARAVPTLQARDALEAVRRLTQNLRSFQNVAS